MTANPQRVDVAPFIDALRRDAEQSRGGLAYLATVADSLAALLHQLAERDAEVERLRENADGANETMDGLRRMVREQRARAEAAERAREEARILTEDAGSALRVMIATAEAARWPITAEQMVPLNMARKEADRIAAYLAANDSRGQMGGRGE